MEWQIFMPKYFVWCGRHSIASVTVINLLCLAFAMTYWIGKTKLVEFVSAVVQTKMHHLIVLFFLIFVANRLRWWLSRSFHVFVHVWRGPFNQWHPPWSVAIRLNRTLYSQWSSQVCFRPNSSPNDSARTAFPILDMFRMIPDNIHWYSQIYSSVHLDWSSQPYHLQLENFPWTHRESYLFVRFWDSSHADVTWEPMIFENTRCEFNRAEIIILNRSFMVNQRTKWAVF